MAKVSTAKINKALMVLIAKGDVVPNPFSIEGTILKGVNRRQPIEWKLKQPGNPQVFDGAPSYITVRCTLERMNRRAADGLGFNVVDMAKVSRGVAKERLVVEQPKAQTTQKSTEKKPSQLKQKLAEPVVASSLPARVIFLVDRSPSMLYPAALSNDKIPQQFRSDDPLLSVSGIKRHELVNQQIDAIVASLSPDFLIDVYDFDYQPTLMQVNASANKFKIGPHPRSSGGTAIYRALQVGLNTAYAYVNAGYPVLLYLLTDGDNNGDVVDVSSSVKKLLDTGKATIAAIGPKSALSFLIPLGVPEGCIRDWQGDGDALNKATVAAKRGAEQFTDAVKQKKSTSLKSFFVDVVATGLTLTTLRRECREITTALHRRKITKYEICKPFVVETMKRSYVPGAAYYQLQKTETLKDGRRIIVQPRGVDSFYAGPKARVLLGLPEKGDCRIEPKNLGDFVVYVQSAAENRKLVPETTFLYDLTHVDGATEPTWSR